jgi:AcrR family transcriptional regulator
MTAERTWPLRTENRERNRAALLAAAAELLEEHGYGGTSLAAIAARAGLTTGAVYSIFGSKAELFIEALLPDWHVPGGAELPFDAPDLESFLDGYARLWVAQLLQGDATRVFELQLELYLAALRDPRLLEKTRGIFAAEQARLTADLERVTEGGPPLDVPAAELARAVVAMLQGLSQMTITMGERPDEDAFARATVRLATPRPERS